MQNNTPLFLWLVTGLMAAVAILAALSLRLLKKFRDADAKRRKIEEELREFYRLGSVRDLAGSIAHDLNNALTAILGNIAIAKMNAGIGPGLAETLEDAEKAAFRPRENSTDMNRHS